MKTIIITDSSMPVQFNAVKSSVFRALEHFGVFYEVVDLAHTKITSDLLKDAHLLILAQESAGKNIDNKDTRVVLKAVSEGMGLLVLDGCLASYPSDFLKDLELFPEAEVDVSEIKLKEDNKVTDSFEYETILKSPVPCTQVKETGNWSVFLRSGENIPCAACKTMGEGRVVFFFLSSRIWQKRYLGFAESLDKTFRDSIAWAAKKPYIMKSMPPFVTARIDDVSFSGSPLCRYRETLEELKWVDILNKYGFIPNTGLFIEDIRDEDAKIFKEKESRGLAEFSPHAFVDFGYSKDDDSCPIYMKHNGEEFTTEELKKNFEKVDAKFKKWGIGYSKTVNVHFAEIGINSLPFIKERGQKYLMTSVRVGKTYSDPQARTWELAPYGINNFCFGYIPEDSHFFNVVSAPKRKDYTVPAGDMLYGCTSLNNESSFTDVEKAVENSVTRIRKGLERGFFSYIVTHEQRIAHLTPEEWELIIKGISEELKNIPHILTGFDHISMYAENRLFSRVSCASYNEEKKEISISLTGRSSMKQQIYLFWEEGERVVEKLIEIPEFEQSLTVNFVDACNI